MRHIFVMNNGEIAAYFEDASKVDETILGEYMLGLKTMNQEQIREAAG